MDFSGRLVHTVPRLETRFVDAFCRDLDNEAHISLGPMEPLSPHRPAARRLLLPPGRWQHPLLWPRPSGATNGAWGSWLKHPSGDGVAWTPVPLCAEDASWVERSRLAGRRHGTAAPVPLLVLPDALGQRILVLDCAITRGETTEEAGDDDAEEAGEEQEEEGDAALAAGGSIGDGTENVVPVSPEAMVRCRDHWTPITLRPQLVVVGTLGQQGRRRALMCPRPVSVAQSVAQHMAAADVPDSSHAATEPSLPLMVPEGSTEPVLVRFVSSESPAGLRVAGIPARGSPPAWERPSEQSTMQGSRDAPAARPTAWIASCPARDPSATGGGLLLLAAGEGAWWMRWPTAPSTILVLGRTERTTTATTPPSPAAAAATAVAEAEDDTPVWVPRSRRGRRASAARQTGEQGIWRLTLTYDGATTATPAVSLESHMHNLFSLIGGEQTTKVSLMEKAWSLAERLRSARSASVRPASGSQQWPGEGEHEQEGAGDPVDMATQTALASLPNRTLRAIRQDLRSATDRSRAHDVLVAWSEELADRAVPLEVGAPGASVSLEQAFRDVARDWVTVNGVSVAHGDAAEADIVRQLNDALAPSVSDASERENVVLGVVRAISRTATGAEAYFAVRALVGADWIITPRTEIVEAAGDNGDGGEESDAMSLATKPIKVNVSTSGSIGLVCDNAFDVFRPEDLVPDREDDSGERGPLPWLQVRVWLRESGSAKGERPRRRTLSVETTEPA